MWSLIAFICAGYVFVGIPVTGLAWISGNWIFMDASLIAYALNLVLLAHAKKQNW